ncbi:MAG: hypothetical protein RJA24_1937 [Pseudomonadota bacterium]
MHAMSITIAIFTLLAVNAAVYAATGRISETVDTLAWFVLLTLFFVETRCPQWARVPRNAVALDLLRLIAAAAILWAAISFVREREWLDALNAWLWIGVVAVLELEVRTPAWIQRQRRQIIALSAALYTMLAGIAVAWLLQGEWFDGYDAVLWIVAFALLEQDLLRRNSANPSAAANNI